MRRSPSITFAWRLALVALGIWAVGSASSHEVRPAILQVTERSNNQYDILWKQPSVGLVAVHLIPHISGGLLDKAPSTIETVPRFPDPSLA